MKKPLNERALFVETYNTFMSNPSFSKVEAADHAFRAVRRAVEFEERLEMARLERKRERALSRKPAKQYAWEPADIERAAKELKRNAHQAPDPKPPAS